MRRDAAGGDGDARVGMPVPRVRQQCPHEGAFAAVPFESVRADPPETGTIGTDLRTEREACRRHFVHGKPDGARIPRTHFQVGAHRPRSGDGHPLDDPECHGLRGNGHETLVSDEGERPLVPVTIAPGCALRCVRLSTP